MSKGIVRVYYGEGHGKSTTAFGTAVREMAKGKSVTMISFMREKSEESEELFKRFEPNLKFFRFEKLAESFKELTQEEKDEEAMNLRNGFNYGKKVISTAASDILILDGVLDLVEHGIVLEDVFLEIFSVIPEDMTVIEGIHMIRDGQNETFRHTNFDPVEYLTYRRKVYPVLPFWNR